MTQQELLLRRRELIQGGAAAESVPYVIQPFTIEANINTRVCFANYDNSVNTITSFKTNKNGAGWVEYPVDELMSQDYSDPIHYVDMVVGDKLSIIASGVWSPYYSGGKAFAICYTIPGGAISGAFNLEGNFLSLYAGDNYLQCKVLPGYTFCHGIFACDNNRNDIRECENLRIPAEEIGNYAFYETFRDQGHLRSDLSNLFPKLKTVGSYAFYRMFYTCRSLIVAPELPATTLGDSCYYGMFNTCNFMTDAPSILPATTLSNNCYRTMFSGCSKITKAPDLPALTLSSQSYRQMFSNCSALNYVKAMFTTTPTNTTTGPTYNWLSNVSSTGTFVKNSAATWTDRGAYAVPTNWTIQTVTP